MSRKHQRDLSKSSRAWRWIRSCVVVSAFVGGGLASGCAGEEESVIILGMPFFVSSNGDIEAAGCGAQAGGSEFMAGMFLDLSFDTGLALPLEFQNNLNAVSANATNSGLDNSEIRLRSIDVSIRVPQAKAIEDALRAVHPNYLDFNLPLPSDSIAGGGTRRIAFLQVPDDILRAMRDAFTENGFADGTELIVMLTVTMHFDLSGGFGKIESREFTVPVHTGINNLRRCETTLWTDEESGAIRNLCTPANCLSTRPYTGNICGNAQWATQYPRCCEGSAAWDGVENAALECGL